MQELMILLSLKLTRIIHSSRAAKANVLFISSQSIVFKCTMLNMYSCTREQGFESYIRIQVHLTLCNIFVNYQVAQRIWMYYNK